MAGLFPLIPVCRLPLSLPRPDGRLKPSRFSRVSSTALGVERATTGGAEDRAPLPRRRLMQPATNTPMPSRTFPSRPPMELQRNQGDLNEPSWGAVHQPPPQSLRPQSNPVIDQLRSRASDDHLAR